MSHQGLASEDCYGFRFERTRTERRPFGNDNFNAHGGSGYFNLCGDSHLYQMVPGKIHAGLTRVVWELNEVGPGEGGTLFISGKPQGGLRAAGGGQRPGQPPVGDLRLPPGIRRRLHRGHLPFRVDLDQQGTGPPLPVQSLQHGELPVGKEQRAA